MRVRLPAGAATSIGSLPHADPAEAVAFALQHTPALPAAPQLPCRSRRELMVAQAASGVAGVTVADDGTIAVDAERLDPDEPVVTAPTDAESAGLLAFLDAVRGRTKPIKLQLCGPVTLGLAFVHAGAPSARAFAAAAVAVRAKASSLVRAARDAAPDAPLLVLFDEPGLTAVDHPGFPLEADPTIDLLSGAMAAAEPAVVGLHCCGDTDWALAVKAGAQVLSLPLEPHVVEDASMLSTFLEEGGWIAWGVVPTNGPVGTDPEPLWRRLTGVWCDLTRAGCDPLLLRKHALLTPACGLANHGPSQAALVMRLTNAVADRVHDQALATRLSVGA